MTGDRQPEVPSELRTVADQCVLAVVRALNRAGVSDPLDRCAVLELAGRALQSRRDQSASVAAQTGTSYAAIGRVTGMSRQAAARRFNGLPR